MGNYEYDLVDGDVGATQVHTAQDLANESQERQSTALIPSSWTYYPDPTIPLEPAE